MSTERQMNFGIKYAATASTQVTAPHFVANCGSANIEKDPIWAEHPNNLTRAKLAPDGYGFDYSWSASDMIVNAHQLGYLIWLALGKDTYLSNVHTLEPDSTVPYCNVFIDKGVDLETSKPTETGLGAKVESLEIEWVTKEFAKVSISGKLCSLGANQAALTPSLPTAATDAALSWKTLQAGSVSIGYDGGSASGDDYVRGLKISMGQDIEPAGIDLGNDQPTAFNEGQLNVGFDITKGFDANALDARTAFLAQSLVELNVTNTISTNNVLIQIPTAVATGGFEGGPGGGVSEVTATLTCDAHTDGTDEAITVTLTDGTTAAYNTL